MEPNVVKVGMREFRSHLPQYLLSSSPIAITRHGETMGFYIPTRHHPELAELEALKQAASQLEKLLVSKGVTVDELIAEFNHLRGRKRKEER
ncbi:MAG TPA: type II toxin-antitoxin system Phd/YefM family antitoxin [Gammaproteobacteria bacterium]|nr:type II toxin-antitoxin system Phd/YefM family antitoxin [Gammaproteobacteria bacterium]